MAQVPLDSQPAFAQSGVARLLMLILLGGMIQSLVVGIHESAHSMACASVGGNVIELSSHHAECDGVPAGSNANRFIAANGAIVNMILGVGTLLVLRSAAGLSATWKWVLWLFMLSNFSSGMGYLLFSGISGVGDFATVIAGWEPAALWRIGMTIIGALLWFALVWFCLRVLAEFFGGDDREEIRKRLFGLSVPAYVGALVASALAASFNSLGITGLPAVAGLIATAGTLSPLLWMPFWYASPAFKKAQVAPLHIRFSTGWVVAALVIWAIYILVMGPGIRFGA